MVVTSLHGAVPVEDVAGGSIFSGVVTGGSVSGGSVAGGLVLNTSSSMVVAGGDSDDVKSDVAGGSDACDDAGRYDEVPGGAVVVSASGTFCGEQAASERTNANTAVRMKRLINFSPVKFSI